MDWGHVIFGAIFLLVIGAGVSFLLALWEEIDDIFKGK